MNSYLLHSLKRQRDVCSSVLGNISGVVRVACARAARRVDTRSYCFGYLLVLTKFVTMACGHLYCVLYGSFRYFFTCGSA